MNADKLVERARIEAGRRNHDGAIVYYLQGLAVDPNSRDARRGVREAELKKFEHMYPSGLVRFLTGIGPRMGLFFASLGKNRVKRMEALEKVLATDPRNAELGMRLGAEAEASNSPTAAAAAYEGVLLGNPEHVGAMIRLGRALQALGEISEALEILEKAVALAPRDQEAQRLRKDLSALGYAKDAGFATARTTYDLLRDKDQAKKHEAAQKIVRAEEDQEARVKAAREAAAKAPSDPAVLSDLGVAEAALRNYGAAEAALEKACSLAPDDVAIRTRLGDVRIGRADRDLAEAQARASSGDATAKAALTGIAKKRLGTMIVEYRERVRTHPTDLAVRFALARHLEESGEYDEAVAEYQQSVRDPRRRPDSLGGLGRCFLAKGMFELAAKQLEKALEEAGSTGGERSKQLLYDLATVKEKQGDPARAREFLARIYEVDIGYQDVAARMESLQRATGK